VISGVVFGDLDGGGTRSPGEAGLSGWTVYLDANLNGSLDAGEASTASAADGSYSLAADPGFYFVREVPKPGFQRTAPAGGDHALLIVSGVARTGIDFGNQPIVPGTISGVVFRDADSDGLRGAGEGGLSGWTVYLDTNFNEAPDAGEPSAISAADGSYRIAASPGFYLVREVVKPSYLLTSPATNAQFADLTAGRAVTNLNFGNYSPLPPAAISGVVYADADGDGVRDAGEGPLAGWTVYLDADGDGSLDAGEASHVTDATGLYSFSVAGGSYTVRQVAQAGYHQTAPASGAYAVTVADGDTAAGRDFGNRPAAVVGDGTISGVVYADADGDGTRDAGEPALAGWTVFLDRNLNGVREAGEPAATTDAVGAYSFTVEAGTYVVREVVQAGYAQTAPASVAYIVTASSASPATGRDFGNAPPAPSGKGTISGVVYDDADGDGTRDAGEEGLPNWEVYLDLNGSGAPEPGEPAARSDASGAYSFAVDPGTYTVREVVQAGYGRTAPASGSHSVAVAAGGDSPGRDFGNRPLGADDGAIAGTVFLDVDRDGLRDEGEPGQAGWTVYLDLNFNGALDASEPAAVTGPAGGYAFDVSPGFYIVREAVQPGFTQTTPAGGLAFAAVTAGGLVGGVDFGNFSRALVGTFSGSVYLDGDGDGVRDAGEGGLAGWTVYLDANLNGTLDAGEASTASAADGAYSFTVLAGSYTVREVVPAGYTRTAPGSGSYAVTVAGGAATGYDFGHVADAAPAATISGALYLDGDGDGVRDAGEGGLAGRTVYLDANLNGTLDAGEASTASAADGSYSFTVLAGTFVVRQVVPVGYAQTAPTPGPHVVTVAAGAVASGRDFGSRALPTTGTITGAVFDDQDGDLGRDAGESGLGGWTIYLDANYNGAFDPGEVSAITGADGTYSFHATPGFHVLRSVPKPGYALTTPPGNQHFILVTVVGTVSRDFGSRST
jgi:hypothetical protein